GTDHKKDVQRRLHNLFIAHDIEPRIHHAHTGAMVAGLADEAARSDAEILVAAGGDGTINSVASAAIQSGKTLGILPFGTMNHFAKDLHIPLDLERAVETIVAGHVVR